MRSAIYHENKELAYPVTVVETDYDDGLAYINAGGSVDIVVRLEKLDFGSTDNPAVTAYEMEKAMDPRSEWERDWDDHCAEVQATRESDRPF